MANYYAKPPEKYKFGIRPQPTGKAISEGMKKAINEKKDILYWIKEFESWEVQDFENEVKLLEDGKKDGITVGYKVALSYFSKIIDGDLKLLNVLWERKYGKVRYTDNRGDESPFELLPLRF